MIDNKETKIKIFAKKISGVLTSSDYKELYSLEGVVGLLKGYGYPVTTADIDDSNWEEIYDILTEV